MDFDIIQIEYGTLLYGQELELRDRLLRKPLGLSSFTEDLSHESADVHFGVIRKDRTQLVGCVILTILSGQRLKLRQMAVDEYFRGLGLGGRLVEKCLAYAREHGYKAVECHSRKTAVGFYEKYGFEVISDEFVEVTIPHYAMRYTM